MGSAIVIEGLNKSYGKLRAVSDLSFSVNEGELFAFLGVNGAGKSTTIAVICGQLRPDSGKITVMGENALTGSVSVRSALGVVFQSSLLDRSLTVRENLRCRGALYGLDRKAVEGRIEEVSALLDMDGILGRRVSRLSGGQRRKADIARALIHSPKILILDEPTTGLDPGTREKLWSAIAYLRERDGLTVLLTTHYMEESATADNVVIIDGGRLVARGTPLELKNRYSGDFISVYGISEEDARSLGQEFVPIPGGFRFSVPDTARATELIVARPELFSDYEIVKGNMDHVFLSVTGKTLGDGGEGK